MSGAVVQPEMTQLIPAAESEALASLPRLPRDEGGPVFAEPWQAQAFALAVKLSAQGHFTWKEWTTALTDELHAAAGRGEPDDGSRYYEHWLAALESLVTAKGLADPTALLARKEAWAAAYQSTPHGQPVALLQSAAPEARWLFLGLACTFVTFWILQHASTEPLGERGIWASWSPSDGGSVIRPLGFAASAGLGTLLGMRHALEPDHLAAVSTLMTGERSSAKAAWLGAWWGLGHTLTLLTTGALLVVLQTEMPAVAARVFEFCVVLLLVGFGVRAIYRGASRVSAGPTHSHRRPAALSPFQVDRWTVARPLLVGAVHGLAGSGALTALVVTTLPSTVTRLGYLTLFGVGSTVGMAALSGLLGWPIARLGAHHVFARTVSLIVGGVSTALGLSWGYPFIEDFL
jgi:nitrile hydratase accessory protein